MENIQQNKHAPIWGLKFKVWKSQIENSFSKSLLPKKQATWVNRAIPQTWGVSISGVATITLALARRAAPGNQGSSNLYVFCGTILAPPEWKCGRSVGVQKKISPLPLPLLSMRSSSPVNSTTSLALESQQHHADLFKASQGFLLMHQTLINLTGSSKSYLSSPTYSMGNFIPSPTTQIKLSLWLLQVHQMFPSNHAPSLDIMPGTPWNQTVIACGHVTLVAFSGAKYNALASSEARNLERRRADLERMDGSVTPKCHFNAFVLAASCKIGPFYTESVHLLLVAIFLCQPPVMRAKWPWKFRWHVAMVATGVPKWKALLWPKPIWPVWNCQLPWKWQSELLGSSNYWIKIVGA